MMQTPEGRALLCTIAICIVLDGAVLVLAIWLAGSLGNGVFLFLVGGGPLTLIVAPQTYSSFRNRFFSSMLHR